MNALAYVDCGGVHITFALLCGEQNRQSALRVKDWLMTVILAALSASLALADDFRTIRGKEYRDATVSRIEPDGIVLRAKSGIVKLYFIELPKEVQERFHYDPQQAAAAPKPQPLNRPKQSTGRPRNSRYENPRPIH